MNSFNNNKKRNIKGFLTIMIPFLYSLEKWRSCKIFKSSINGAGVGGDRGFGGLEIVKNSGYVN